MDMKEASSGKSWVSTLEIYVNLVTVCIGVGILALPQLPVRCGYILASLCLALAGLGVHEACLQLWRGLGPRDTACHTATGSKLRLWWTTTPPTECLQCPFDVESLRSGCNKICHRRLKPCFLCCYEDDAEFFAPGSIVEPSHQGRPCWN